MLSVIGVPVLVKGYLIRNFDAWCSIEHILLIYEGWALAINDLSGLYLLSGGVTCHDSSSRLDSSS